MKGPRPGGKAKIDVFLKKAGKEGLKSARRAAICTAERVRGRERKEGRGEMRRSTNDN
jgi:hypothetical protein